MAASTIPAAKAALLAALEARPALAAPVEVRWGLPAQTPTSDERIVVDDVADVEREWAALGGQKIDEEYVLQVRVETFLAGDDQRTTEERFWELVNEVEQAVRSDLRLDETVRESGLDGVADPKVGATDEGWGASGVVRIRCQARI